jgi:hypothetical protein
MWHGILVYAAFVDDEVINRFDQFAQKRDDDWTIVGIETQDAEFESTITQLQKMMRKDAPFYFHFYNDRELVVVFQDRTFRVTPQADSWQPILEYAETLSIPAEQLQFFPVRFKDEQPYFNPPRGL